jgi:hypothetical protein
MLESDPTAHPTTWVSKTDLYTLHPELAPQIDALNEGDMIVLARKIGDAVSSTHHMATDILLPAYLGLETAESIDDEDGDSDEPDWSAEPITLYHHETLLAPRYTHEGWHGTGESQVSAYLTWLTFTHIAEEEELENHIIDWIASISDLDEAALTIRELVTKSLFGSFAETPSFTEVLARQSLRREVNWQEIVAAYQD